MRQKAALPERTKQQLLIWKFSKSAKIWYSCTTYAQFFYFIDRKPPSRELPQTRFLGDTGIYAVNTELSINRMSCLELPI